MAGVLEMIGWPQKRLVVDRSASTTRVDRRVSELQTAKEILAEIFGVRISDVEEMIQNRFDETCFKEDGSEEMEPWPREFVLGE